MKLSEILYGKVEGLWEAAVKKPFVVGMAQGTLQEDCFRYYMIQDYLYLLDYIGILRRTMDLAQGTAMKSFLRTVIEETEYETKRVHVPNMKKIGIDPADAGKCPKDEAFAEYVGYMRRQLDEEGVRAGLTALLQCSWIYAYIGRKVSDEYVVEISDSPYKSWFDAYACDEYDEANRRWIDVLDGECEGISSQETEKLCEIFVTCAKYENRLWDALIEPHVLS